MSGATELVLPDTSECFTKDSYGCVNSSIYDCGFQFPNPQKKKKQDGEMIKLQRRFCEKHCLTRQISIIVALQIRKWTMLLNRKKRDKQC